MRARFSSTHAGSACVLLASAIWGTMGTTATFAPRVGPLGMGAATTGLGGILLALTAINSIVESWGRIAGQWPTLALGAISVGVYPLAFYSSMHLPRVAVGKVISIGSAPPVAAMYMALIPVVLAYALFGFDLARISATTARTLSLLEPVIAAVLAVVIVCERLQMEGWAGIRLIVGRLVALTTSSSAKQVSAAAPEEI